MPDQSNVGEKGIVTKASPYPSVSETLQRLRRMVREKGLEEFALIDQSGAVERVGLEMQEALREHGASIVVTDLSELLGDR